MQIMMQFCFTEAQFHPELRDALGNGLSRIAFNQSEVIGKMTDVVEAFFQTAMDRGIYRPMNPKIVAQIFLGMFAIAGFSHNTIMESNASPQTMQEMAEGLADIFLDGVLAKSE